MKKLLGIVVLGLFFISSVQADEKIYYCIDDAATGYDIDKSGTISKNYAGSRWKAKIDFEKGIFEPKGIGLIGGWKNAGGKYSFTDGSISFVKFYDKLNFKYIRSSHFGPVDSVYVAIGSCSKF